VCLCRWQHVSSSSSDARGRTRIDLGTTVFFIHCNYHMYADDVQIYISCQPSEIMLCTDNLNADLSRIHQWSLANGISLNTSKSQAMVINKPRTFVGAKPSFVLGNEPIQIFNKVKNLGIIFNDKLTWTDHVDYIRKSAAFSLRRLWSTIHFTSTEVRKKEIIPKRYIFEGLLRNFRSFKTHLQLLCKIHLPSPTKRQCFRLHKSHLRNAT
jgi:hypothetical protein